MPLKERVPPENIPEFGGRREFQAVLVILNLSNGKSFIPKQMVFFEGKYCLPNVIFAYS